MKHQPSALTNVLRRSVETATQNGTLRLLGADSHFRSEASVIVSESQPRKQRGFFGSLATPRPLPAWGQKWTVTRAGRDVPAQVFSDGSDEELAGLLALPAVRRMDYGSGLGDMLGLSRSRLLIASGSTFSMWGSYLGQVPAIWHPRKLLQHVLIEHPEREIEWAPGGPLPDWVAQLI